MRRWTNENATPQTTGIDLSSIGTLGAGQFAIIAANGTAFQTQFGISADISAGTGGAADSNGDDQIASSRWNRHNCRYFWSSWRGWNRDLS